MRTWLAVFVIGAAACGCNQARSPEEAATWLVESAAADVQDGELGRARRSVDLALRLSPASTDARLLGDKVARLPPGGRAPLAVPRRPMHPLGDLRLHEALHTEGPDPPAVAALRRRLHERRVTVSFDGTRLEEAASFLRDAFDLPLDVDPWLTSEEVTVALRLREVPAIDLLRILAIQTDLVVTLRGDRLLLSDRW